MDQCASMVFTKFPLKNYYDHTSELSSAPACDFHHDISCSVDICPVLFYNLLIINVFLATNLDFVIEMDVCQERKSHLVPVIVLLKFK